VRGGGRGCCDGSADGGGWFVGVASGAGCGAGASWGCLGRSVRAVRGTGHSVPVAAPSELLPRCGWQDTAGRSGGPLRTIVGGAMVTTAGFRLGPRFDFRVMVVHVVGVGSELMSRTGHAGLDAIGVDSGVVAWTVDGQTAGCWCCCGQSEGNGDNGIRRWLSR
jgi:hypothetical protein